MGTHTSRHDTRGASWIGITADKKAILTTHVPNSGGFFLLGGVLLFFDRALLAMGNILFLAGLTLIIGLAKTFAFFARRQKLKGTVSFLTGIVLILARWPLVGFVVELYGIFVLFGDFFSTIAGFAANVPVVGPYLAVGLRKAGAAASGGSSEKKNSELPV